MSDIIDGPDTLPAPPVVEYCGFHPEVPASIDCSVCHAHICPTCDFAFPNNIHLCPKCVQKSPGELNPRISKNTRIAWGTAIGSTIALVSLPITATFIGDSEEANAVLGFAMFFLSFVPAIVGCAMGIGVMPRKSKKPAGLVVAVTWNAIVLSSFILLCVVGSLSE